MKRALRIAGGLVLIVALLVGMVLSLVLCLWLLLPKAG